MYIALVPELEQFQETSNLHAAIRVECRTNGLILTEAIRCQVISYSPCISACRV